MKIAINYESNRVNAVINGNATLTEVSFAVESALANFFGRGVFRFECYRTKASNGSCELNFYALQKAGPMVASKTMSVATCLKSGFVSTNLTSFKNESSSLAKDGQHRHKKMHSGTHSVIEYPQGLKLDSTLGDIGYGMSDMLTGLFALGVEYVKWQAGTNLAELYVQHELTELQLLMYLKSSVDYDINRKVNTL